MITVRRISASIVFIFLSAFAFQRFAAISSLKLFSDLISLVISIVCLDLFRSFQQLNYGYHKLIFANLVGIGAFISFHFFGTRQIGENFDMSPLTAWVISNLIGAFLLLLQLKSSTRKYTENDRQTLDTLTVPTRYSQAIATEFLISRVANFVGLTILYRIDEITSANLALALFVFSTLPYSISNGLLPIFLRKRLLRKDKYYRNQFFVITAISLTIIPTLCILLPDLITLVFGNLWRLPPILVLYVILSVALKVYDSVQSLDYMIQNRTSRYLLAKTPTILLVNLTSPVLLGVYAPEIACFVLVLSILIQIGTMERKLS